MGSKGVTDLLLLPSSSYLCKNKTKPVSVVKYRFDFNQNSFTYQFESISISKGLVDIWYQENESDRKDGSEMKSDWVHTTHIWSKL